MVLRLVGIPPIAADDRLFGDMTSVEAALSLAAGMDVGGVTAGF